MRRARKTRARIREQQAHRLSVYRSSQHIYAQLFDREGDRVLVSASTLDGELKGGIEYGGNKQAAEAVGRAIALRARKAGITQVAFDRSGFRYHGRIQALADAARANGMEF